MMMMFFFFPPPTLSVTETVGVAESRGTGLWDGARGFRADTLQTARRPSGQPALRSALLALGLLLGHLPRLLLFFEQEGFGVAVRRLLQRCHSQLDRVDLLNGGHPSQRQPVPATAGAAQVAAGTLAPAPLLGHWNRCCTGSRCSDRRRRCTGRGRHFAPAPLLGHGNRCCTGSCRLGTLRPLRRRVDDKYCRCRVDGWCWVKVLSHGTRCSIGCVGHLGRSPRAVERRTQPRDQVQHRAVERRTRPRE